jgi:hypothetical protein
MDHSYKLGGFTIVIFAQSFTVNNLIGFACTCVCAVFSIFVLIVLLKNYIVIFGGCAVFSFFVLIVLISSFWVVFPMYFVLGRTIINLLLIFWLLHEHVFV